MKISTTFRSFIFFTISNLCLLSCKKDNDNFPPALKYITLGYPGCVCDPYLNEYMYKSETVYVLLTAEPACDSRPVYYKSNGEELIMQTGYTFEMFIDDSHYVKRIWTCNE